MFTEYSIMMNDNKQRLVIRISRNSLSFSTASSNGVEFYPYSLNSSISMAANLREALRTVPLLTGNTFNNTLVVVDSPVLMVPVDIFRQEEQETFYSHSFPRVEGMVVLNTVLNDINSVAVFSIQKDIRTVLCDTFTNVRFAPAIAPVWRHLHRRSYTGQHQKLFVYFHDRYLEIFSFQQNRFKFCNSYAAASPNDALYYLLAAWKQLSLDAEHDELHLAGDIPERETMLEETKKFIKRVFYIHPSGEFNRARVTQIAGMPYDLITLFMGC